MRMTSPVPLKIELFVTYSAPSLPTATPPGSVSTPGTSSVRVPFGAMRISAPVQSLPLNAASRPFFAISMT
jgi:hypothetical protein